MVKKFVQKLIHTLSRKYRVDFLDAETLSGSQTFSVRPILWIGGFIALFLGVIAGTASLIWYTPAIRTQIPGYTNPKNEEKLLVMQSTLDTLKKEIVQRDEFIQSLQNATTISGQPLTPSTEPTPAKDPKQTDVNAKHSLSEVPKITPQNDEKTNVKPSPGDGLGKQGKVSKKEIMGIGAVVRPVVGLIREDFSPAKGHLGIDIVTSENQSVLAATGGVVIMADYSESDGHVIGISSSNGVITIYKHNSRILKRKGAFVNAGEPIAIVGNTGENTTGPHLHFEMWYQGEPLNPRDYVPYK